MKIYPMRGYIHPFADEQRSVSEHIIALPQGTVISLSSLIEEWNSSSIPNGIQAIGPSALRKGIAKVLSRLCNQHILLRKEENDEVFYVRIEK